MLRSLVLVVVGLVGLWVAREESRQLRQGRSSRGVLVSRNTSREGSQHEDGVGPGWARFWLAVAATACLLLAGTFSMALLLALKGDEAPFAAGECAAWTFSALTWALAFSMMAASKAPPSAAS